MEKNIDLVLALKKEHREKYRSDFIRFDFSFEEHREKYRSNFSFEKHRGKLQI